MEGKEIPQELRQQLRVGVVQPTRLPDGWDEADVIRELGRPFPPEALHWKVQAHRPNQEMALVVVYVSARAVIERLNESVGLGWSTRFGPEVLTLPYFDLKERQSKEERGIACALHIYDAVRMDVGTPSSTEPLKGMFSDALKRAAVQYGLGAYLYRFPRVRARMNGAFISWDAQSDLDRMVDLIYQGVETMPTGTFQHIQVAAYRPVFEVTACDNCGGPITSRQMSPPEAAYLSMERFGAHLCREHAIEQYRAEQTEEQAA